MMLVITAAGLKALDGESARGTPKHSDRVIARAKKGRAEPKAVNAQGKNRKKPTSRTRTKQDLLIHLLKRKSGASIAEIVTATGWQAHSVRGAISGTLKKKLGLMVSSERAADRGRVYRITEPRR
jgi:hypothetical protein